MSKTEKIRKGPSESATIFPIGTIKKGNDGNKWKIIETDSGVHRWSKMTVTKLRPPASHKRTVKNKNITKGDIEKVISLAELKKIGERNTVSTAGKSKGAIAELLFNIRGNALSTDDLQDIHNLLPSKQKREARQMIATQTETPITDYKGMWKPAPKPLHEMSRREMINSLRKFRDAWEKNIGRNQDLSDEKLAGDYMTDKDLRQRLEYYYSETAKNQAANWIRDNL
jgi:hypothetical protein